MKHRLLTLPEGSEITQTSCLCSVSAFLCPLLTSSAKIMMYLFFSQCSEEDETRVLSVLLLKL